MGWTISSVDGESQQGGFIDAGTSVDAILLQHGSYVFDMTVESGTGTGKYCGSLKLFAKYDVKFCPARGLIFHSISNSLGRVLIRSYIEDDPESWITLGGTDSNENDVGVPLPISIDFAV